MSDLRTYQTLAYLTHQPTRYRELLGLPKGEWASHRGGRLPLLNLSGRLLTRTGQWLLARAGEPAETPAAPQTRQMA